MKQCKNTLLHPEQNTIVKSNDNTAKLHEAQIKQLILTVYHLAQVNSPLSQIKPLVQLLKLSRVNVGDKYTNDVSARGFLLSLAHVVRKSIIEAAATSPCIGLAIDESTDISHTSQMIMYLLVFKDGMFQTLFGRIVTVHYTSANGIFAHLTVMKSTLL